MSFQNLKFPASIILIVLSLLATTQAFALRKGDYEIRFEVVDRSFATPEDRKLVGFEDEFFLKAYVFRTDPDHPAGTYAGSFLFSPGARRSLLAQLLPCQLPSPLSRIVITSSSNTVFSIMQPDATVDSVLFENLRPAFMNFIHQWRNDVELDLSPGFDESQLGLLAKSSELVREADISRLRYRFRVLH